MRVAAFETRFPPSAGFGSRTLETVAPNRRGSDIALLQLIYNLMLNIMEPPHGSIGPSIDADGVYGPRTRVAVLALQTYFGVTADGIAGPQTFSLFGQGGVSDTSHGRSRYGRRTLSTGAAGPDVKILQSRLSCFSYARLLGRPADGRFDRATASALRAFQTDAGARGQLGISPNGVANAATFNATWLYTFAGGRRLFTGRNGFDVVYLQACLRELGLYRGPLDGYFGQRTGAAVQDLQSGAGLRRTGVAGPQTYYALGCARAATPPDPLPPIRF